ncbi:MAG: hypothetical protein ACMXYF_01640 [Candidatus Woesearchaeota archaeon]
MNKKAIELSVNFLVTFILAIVVFSGGLFIVNTMLSAADSSLEDLGRNFVEDLSRLQCQNQRYCIIDQNQRINQIGTFRFGLVIRNSINQSDITLQVQVDHSEVTGFYRDNVKMNLSELGWEIEPREASDLTIFPFPDRQTIEFGRDEAFVVVVNIPRGSKIERGRYHIPFNISCVNLNCGFPTVRDRLTFEYR